MDKKTQFQAEALLDELLESYALYPVSTRMNVKNILNRDLLIDILEKIRQILFPGFYERSRVRADYVRYTAGEKLEYVQYHLTKQVSIALGIDKTGEDAGQDSLRQQAEEIVNDFLTRLPALREILATDIQAGYDGDPAATVD